jgi:hypothetical protein
MPRCSGQPIRAASIGLPPWIAATSGSIGCRGARAWRTCWWPGDQGLTWLHCASLSSTRREVHNNGSMGMPDMITTVRHEHIRRELAALARILPCNTGAVIGQKQDRRRGFRKPSNKRCFDRFSTVVVGA